MSEKDLVMSEVIFILPFSAHRNCDDSKRRGCGWGVVKVEKQISPLRCSR
jgi:hypothetical protein